MWPLAAAQPDHVLVRQMHGRLGDNSEGDTMTLTMADSITPANLPGGYNAYLGYVDGSWPDFQAEVARFPGAHILSLTVFGGTDVADGCDIENGALSPESGAAYAARRLADGQWRPVQYADVSNMDDVLAELAKLKIARASVRLLSAHYGAGEHICGPGTCNVSVPMDGTQWTDTAPGVGGSQIDASLLLDDFFGGTPDPTPTSWQETMMLALPTLQKDAAGAQVRTVQGLLLARGYSVTLDGVFGPATQATVERFQGNAHLSADGVVGPQTWPALMDV